MDENTNQAATNRPSARMYKYWELHEEMPNGFFLHSHCGSPLSNYAFASNGGILDPGRRTILVRVFCQLTQK